MKTLSHNYCCICKAWAINETKSSKNATTTNTFIQRASCIAQELKLRSATCYSTTLTVCTTDHTWYICHTQKWFLQYCDRQANRSKKSGPPMTKMDAHRPPGNL